MKLLRYLAATSIFLLFLLPETKGQIQDSFNKDPKFFLKELDEYMNSGKNEACRRTYDEFKSLYDAGTIAPERFDLIYGVCNKMLGRKMLAAPYFLDYFIAANALVKDSLTADAHMAEWTSVATSILDGLRGGRFNDYSNFLQFSIDLFQEQSLYFTPNGPIWKCSSPISRWSLPTIPPRSDWFTRRPTYGASATRIPSWYAAPRGFTIPFSGVGKETRARWIGTGRACRG